MTLVKSTKIEHQYELGNSSYAQIDPNGGVTIYNEDNIVVLGPRQAYALWDALKDAQSDMSLFGSTPSGGDKP